MRETHVSWVVFVADRVYKVKKPVAFRFLDWTTVEAREEACRMEVLLNRRLAPDVYVGVGHFTGPDGSSEPVVVMKRLPDDRSLSALIGRGDGSLSAWTQRIAGVLADFHAGAARGPSVERDCTHEAATARWRENLAELSAIAGSGVAPSALAEADRLARRWLDGRRPLFDERLRAGRAVDGHGDLLCDDIFCIPEGVRILDCLEFDPVLRHGDTAGDLAALAMDLERLGRPDLATSLISDYQAASGDVWPRSLTDFWIAYRALVRAKVGAYRCADLAGREAEAQHADVDRLITLALDHLRAARIRVVLVGGLPGTGKTTLAKELGERTGWPVLGSDALRRAGVQGGQDTRAPYGQALYAPACVEANYQALIAAAGERIGLGESVILDASWTRAPWRQVAEAMASLRSADLVRLECTVPFEEARRRLLARRASGDRLSDATPEVAAAMAAVWDPWPEAVELDTSASASWEDIVARALSAVS